MAKEKEKPLKKYSIIVKFEHLNPMLQNIIKAPARKELKMELRSSKLASIRTLRGIRASVEGLGLLNLVNLIFNPTVKKSAMLGLVSVVGASALAGGHQGVVELVQLRHTDLVKSMKKFGILKPGRTEAKYPRDWINPVTVAKTHPMFFVNYKGNIIFPKMTRTEYARYVFQKRWPGQLGLHPWRWRAYLEPPERPEKVADFVNAKIKQWLATMRPKPAFGIATARAKTVRQRKARSKHKRRA